MPVMVLVGATVMDSIDRQTTDRGADPLRCDGVQFRPALERVRITSPVIHHIIEPWHQAFACQGLSPRSVPLQFPTR